MSTVIADLFKNRSGREFAPIHTWVNFNGTGTVAIRDSLNVSSITDVGAGWYRINFSDTLINTNYCISGTAIHDTASNNGAILYPTDYQLNYIDIQTGFPSSTGGSVTPTDSPYINIQITGGI